MQAGHLYVNFPRRRLVKLHEGWLEHRSSQDSKWKRYWCTLRGNIVYIFNNETDTHEQHIATLSIDPASRLEKKDGDEKTGYRFDLHSGRRINKFRTKKFSDRELWRAFVEGVAKGYVSPDVDLPEKLIEDIKKALQDALGQESPPPVQCHCQRRGSTGGINDDFDRPQPNLAKSKFHTMHHLQPVKRPLPSIPPPSPPTPGKNLYKRDFVFYTDPTKRDIPCWFFKDCSRDIAMEILVKAVKHNLGNTLMRSRPSDDQQAIVISKLVNKGSSNEFSHYEVQSVAGGYIIVLDETHKPEKSLEGLMEFFKQRSGSLMTKFLTCNDLKKLGVETDSADSDPYMRSIAHVQLDHESGEQSDQSSAESGYLSAHFSSPSSWSSVEGSAEGSFSSAISSSDSSQHLDSSLLPMPPPPPIPTFSMTKKNSSTEPPSSHHNVSETRTNVKRSQSNVSVDSHRMGPQVMPKPLIKSGSFDEGARSETASRPNFIQELHGVLRGQSHGQGLLRRLSNQHQQFPEEDPYENIDEIQKNIARM